MSYDLFFVAPSGPDPPAPEAIREHFGHRPWFKVSDDQAVYLNDDTGVYFSFDVLRSEEVVEEVPAPAAPWAMLSLDFLRSGIFALEACEEIRALLEQFGGAVYDPSAAAPPAEFSDERFLTSWQQGNAAGVRLRYPHDPGEGDARSEDQEPLPPVVDLQTRGELWKWNYLRQSLQNEEGGDIFVPKISLFSQGGRVLAGVVWTDAMPILMPQIDGVVMLRQETAPRKLLRRKMDRSFLAFSAMAHLFADKPSMDSPSRLHLPEQLEEARRFFEAWKSPGTSAQPLDPDAVLDAELFG